MLNSKETPSFFLFEKIYIYSKWLEIKGGEIIICCNPCLPCRKKNLTIHMILLSRDFQKALVMLLTLANRSTCSSGRERLLDPVSLATSFWQMLCVISHLIYCVFQPWAMNHIHLLTPSDNALHSWLSPCLTTWVLVKFKADILLLVSDAICILHLFHLLALHVWLPC